MSLLLRRGIVSSGVLDAGGTTLFAANSALMNGTNQDFTAGNVLNMGTSDISIMGRFTHTGTATKRLVFKGVINNEEYNLYLADSGEELRFRYGSDSSNHITRTTTGASLNDGDEHQVIIFSNRAGTMVFAIDGAIVSTSVVASAGDPSAADITTTEALFLGSRGSANFLGGEMAGFGISIGSDLTADRVELWNGGNMLCFDELAPATQAKFTSHWPLENHTGFVGQELLDQKGSNDLTGNNSPPFTGSSFTVECT